MTSVRRWPLQTILDLGHTKHRLMQLAGMGGETLALAGREGLTDWEADRLAAAIGRHPAEVWDCGEWIDTGLSVCDRRFVDEGGWRPAWLWAEGSAA